MLSDAWVRTLFKERFASRVEKLDRRGGLFDASKVFSFVLGFSQCFDFVSFVLSVSLPSRGPEAPVGLWSTGYC